MLWLPTRDYGRNLGLLSRGDRLADFPKTPAAAALLGRRSAKNFRPLHGV